MIVNLKTQKGITLISLTVTVIVLLVLAGVTMSISLGDDGIIQKALNTKKQAETENLKQEQGLADIESAMLGVYGSSDGYDYIGYVNAPHLKEGMIPITYNESTKTWIVADKTNPNNSWYNYDNRVWANICTVDNANASYRTAEVGTEIPLSAMTTMFVWIPRYAYSIVNNYQTSNTEAVSTTNARETKNIEIKFLVGQTNRDIDGKTYPTNYDPETEVTNGKTPMIVHPAFYYDEMPITGIWVAKFEASGTNSSGKAVGNHENGTTLIQPETTTPVKILPNVVSWRNITQGESEYRCTQMSSNTAVYGWANVNTHLIKNSEWGAVAYLCYSKFGSVPMINGCGDVNGNYYDIYTGMGPASKTSENRYATSSKSGHEYNTEIGMLASTTGNVYGVYDMSGGAYDSVATFLDNGNSNLDTYGKSTTDSSVKYIENGELNSEYSALWEAYQVSDEEKNNQIAVEGEETLTQAELWAKSGSSYTDTEVNKKYNTARKRITDSTFNLLAAVKGIGVNEISGEKVNNVLTKTHSYYGVASSGSFAWLIEAEDTSTKTAVAWNNDYVCIGHASYPFVMRGGHINNGTGAGVLYTAITNGSAYHYYGFRAVLCP